jgi:curli biogenesis system outer membrane secretion channel CsgG
MTTARCLARPLPLIGAPLRRAVLLTAATLLAALAGPVPAADSAAPLPALVVWDFDDQTVPALSGLPAGHADWLQRSLSESLVGALLQMPGQRVVDRLRLRAVLAEQKLGAGELADEATRLRLGRIVGAQRMVFGGFFVVGGMVQINLRVVETATSRVLFADESTAPFDAVMQDQPQLAARVVRALGGADAAVSSYPADVWQAHDRALALADAGRLDEALAALQALLSSHPGFAPAERLVPVLLQSMARR